MSDRPSLENILLQMVSMHNSINTINTKLDYLTGLIIHPVTDHILQINKDHPINKANNKWEEIVDTEKDIACMSDVLSVSSIDSEDSGFMFSSMIHQKADPLIQESSMPAINRKMSRISRLSSKKEMPHMSDVLSVGSVESDDSSFLYTSVRHTATQKQQNSDCNVRYKKSKDSLNVILESPDDRDPLMLSALRVKKMTPKGLLERVLDDMDMNEVTDRTKERVSEVNVATKENNPEATCENKGKVLEVTGRPKGKVHEATRATKETMHGIIDEYNVKLHRASGGIKGKMHEITSGSKGMLHKVPGGTEWKMHEPTSSTKGKIHTLTGGTKGEMYEVTGATKGKLHEVTGRTEGKVHEATSETKEKLHKGTHGSKGKMHALTSAGKEKMLVDFSGSRGKIHEATGRTKETLHEATDRTEGNVHDNSGRIERKVHDVTRGTEGKVEKNTCKTKWTFEDGTDGSFDFDTQNIFTFGGKSIIGYRKHRVIPRQLRNSFDGDFRLPHLKRRLSSAAGSREHRDSAQSRASKRPKIEDSNDVEKQQQKDLEGEQIYVCSACFKWFPDVLNLMRHSRICVRLEVRDIDT